MNNKASAPQKKNYSFLDLIIGLYFVGCAIYYLFYSDLLSGDFTNLGQQMYDYQADQYAVEQTAQKKFKSDTEKSKALFAYREAYYDSLYPRQYVVPGAVYNPESKMEYLMKYDIEHILSKNAISGFDEMNDYIRIKALFATHGAIDADKNKWENHNTTIGKTYTEIYRDYIKKLNADFGLEDPDTLLQRNYRDIAQTYDKQTEVARTRLEFLGIPYRYESHKSADLVPEAIQIECYDFLNPELMRKLIAGSGSRQLWAAYHQDLLPDTIKKVAKEALLQGEDEPYILGYVRSVDEKKALSKALKKFKKLMPPHLHLIWSFAPEAIQTKEELEEMAQTEEENQGNVQPTYGYKLYLLRDETDDPDYLNEHFLSRLNVQSNYDIAQNSEEPVKQPFEISIDCSKCNWGFWNKFKTKNELKHLALMIDNEVAYTFYIDRRMDEFDVKIVDNHRMRDFPYIIAMLQNGTTTDSFEILEEKLHYEVQQEDTIRPQSKRKGDLISFIINFLVFVAYIMYSSKNKGFQKESVTNSTVKKR